MNDMSAVIIAKSDQWNADDFVDGPRTFTIEAVQIRPGTEQPVQITLAGSRKFFRPCKTVSRVLVAAWKADANAYVGRSLTLYTDPNVTWGGMKVGGIRVSHMSHIDRPLVIALQEKKGSRKMTTIEPLKVERAEQAQKPTRTAEQWATDHIAFVVGSADLDRLAHVQTSGAKAMEKLATTNPEQHKRVQDAYDKRFAELSGENLERRDDTDMGETDFGGMDAAPEGMGR